MMHATKRVLLSLLFLIFVLNQSPVHALDPVFLAGGFQHQAPHPSSSSQAKKPVKHKQSPFFGFVQVLALQNLGAQVNGLNGPLTSFNQTKPLFNRAGGESAFAVKIPRARIASRGFAPYTHQKIHYFFMLEAGQVGITRTNPVMPVEYSITLAYLPFMKIRIGYFKLPTMEEILLPVPKALEFVHFSKTLLSLVNENPIQGGALPSGGQYQGGANGFRDRGIQVFDSFLLSKWRVGYAVMASQGTRHFKNQTSAFDLSSRVEFAYQWDRKGGLRNREIKVALWRLQGTRDLQVQDDASGDASPQTFKRIRQGLTLKLERKKYWAMMERVEAEGVLETGRVIPFPNAGIRVSPTGQAKGIVVQGGYRFFLGSPSSVQKKAEFGVKGRIESFEQDYDDPNLHRIFKTYTIGLEWRPAPLSRIQLEYEFRSLEAPFGSRNAQILADSYGDQVVFQVTQLF